MRRETGRDAREAEAKTPTLLAIGLLLASAALNLAPADVTARLRSAVRDGLAPGQQLVQKSIDLAERAWRRRDPSANGETESDRDRNRALAARNRRLELELAALRERLETAEEFGRRPRATASKPLLIPELIEADWLGEEISTLIRANGLLSVGSAERLVESALVLQSELPLIDQGESSELATGDSVYAGRIVVGKIADVGRYASTVRRVTDSEFSGRARVARRTDEGLEVIAEGTLVGDGSDACLLKHVTEPIAVGDEVYTSGADGVLRLPMYYGRVTRAELAPAAREWTIVVTPAAASRPRDKVQVLRLSVNRDRLLGN